MRKNKGEKKERERKKKILIDVEIPTFQEILFGHHIFIFFYTEKIFFSFLIAKEICSRLYINT